VGVVVQELATLSPSQYGRILRCPYQVLLEKSVEGRAALAAPGMGAGGAGPLGTIIHGVLETAHKTGINDSAAFELAWEQQLKAQETSLIKRKQQHLVPLAYRAKNYAVKKLLLRWLVLGMQSEQQAKGQQAVSVPLGPEQRLTDATGRISGIADLIRYGPSGALEILDYKTGRIFSEALGENAPDSVKEEYALQLRLYAALLHEQAGVWPERLLVVDLAGGEHQVSFTQEQCTELMHNAQSLYQKIFAAVSVGRATDLARPSLPLCTACKMQHLCEPYKETVSIGGSGF
jgi:RecB family exonuclease